MRKRRPILLPVALLNVVTIVSVLTEGGHFLIDVIAGAAVAGAAIWATAHIEAMLHHGYSTRHRRFSGGVSAARMGPATRASQRASAVARMWITASGPA